MATHHERAATPRATHLQRLATDLVVAAPLELAAIAVTGGSLANGLADQWSDVEIHLWAPEMPTRDRRSAFLESFAAKEIWWHDTPGKDGSEWVRFRFREELFEVGWQTTDAFERVVDALANGDPWGKGRIGIGWVITRGEALRGQDIVRAARQRLLPYPEQLARIVAGATVANQWLDREARRSLLALAERGQWLRLTDELLTDAYAILRVLFAANGRYEPPSWKWVTAEAADLALAPRDLLHRLEWTLDNAQRDPKGAVAENAALVRETIELCSEASGFTAPQCLGPTPAA
jgi:hypothetical protein